MGVIKSVVLGTLVHRQVGRCATFVSARSAEVGACDPESIKSRDSAFFRTMFVCLVACLFVCSVVCLILRLFSPPRILVLVLAWFWFWCRFCYGSSVCSFPVSFGCARMPRCGVAWPCCNFWGSLSPLFLLLGSLLSVLCVTCAVWPSSLFSAMVACLK